MKSGTGEVHMSLGMAYWSAIQPELVVERTGVGVVVTHHIVVIVVVVLMQGRVVIIVLMCNGSVFFSLSNLQLDHVLSYHR